MIHLALYQPDIPQNTGAAIRLCACMGLNLDIIEPCAFPWDDKKIRRGAMDYYDAAHIKRHASWQHFIESYQNNHRIILLTTKAAVPYTEFTFEKNDILLAGNESSGAPDNVHKAADARILIPMQGNMRSLNVINALSMVSGEALRQIQT